MRGVNAHLRAVDGVSGVRVLGEGFGEDYAGVEGTTDYPLVIILSYISYFCFGSLRRVRSFFTGEGVTDDVPLTLGSKEE